MEGEWEVSGRPVEGGRWGGFTDAAVVGGMEGGEQLLAKVGLVLLGLGRRLLCLLLEQLCTEQPRELALSEGGGRSGEIRRDQARSGEIRGDALNEGGARGRGG